jgi:hypothetical protein
MRESNELYRKIIFSSLFFERENFPYGKKKKKKKKEKGGKKKSSRLGEPNCKSRGAENYLHKVKDTSLRED